MNIPASIERIVLALWVGGLWSIGLVVAPELFRSLESRQVAGAIAGNLFTVMNYSGLIAATILLALAHRQHQYRWQSFRQWRTLLLITMLILVVISQFVLTPMMQEIKQARLVTAVISLDTHNKFAILHGLSSILYLLTGISGLVLVAAGATGKSN